MLRHARTLGLGLGRKPVVGSIKRYFASSVGNERLLITKGDRVVPVTHGASNAEKPAGWDEQRVEELCALSLQPLRAFASKVGVCAEGGLRDLAIQVLAAEDARSHWPDMTSDQDMIAFKGPRMPSIRVLARAHMAVKPVTEDVSVDVHVKAAAPVGKRTMNNKSNSSSNSKAATDDIEPDNVIDQRQRDVPVISTKWVKETLEYMTLLKQRIPKLYVMFVLRQALVLHRFTHSLAELQIPRFETAEDGTVAVPPFREGLSHHLPQGTCRVTVVGDTHGQFFDLLNLLSPAVAGYPSASTPFVFNGDFVDRGIYSFETIFALLAMKVASPQSVHLIRGNHETTDMNSVYGFEKQILGKYDQEVLDMFRKVFQALPLAATINKRAFITHGGIGQLTSRMTLEQIAAMDRFIEPSFPSAISELLWSDPTDKHQGLTENRQRGAGWSFGKSITNSFLEKNNLELLVRSHEARQHGYSVHHGGRCITIFSAPNYCDTQGNLGAVLVFERSEDQKEQFAAAAAAAAEDDEDRSREGKENGKGKGEAESKEVQSPETATPEEGTGSASADADAVPKIEVNLPGDASLSVRITSGSIYAIGNNVIPQITSREESHDKTRADSIPGQEPMVTKVLQFTAVPHPLSPKRINPLPTLKN